jgi:hypothetical protein
MARPLEQACPKIAPGVPIPYSVGTRATDQPGQYREPIGYAYGTIPPKGPRRGRISQSSILTRLR